MTHSDSTCYIEENLKLNTCVSLLGRRLANYGTKKLSSLTSVGDIRSLFIALPHLCSHMRSQKLMLYSVSSEKLQAFAVKFDVSASGSKDKSGMI